MTTAGIGPAHTPTYRGATEKYFEAVAHRLEAGRSRALGKSMTPRDMTSLALVVFDQARGELLRALASAKRTKPAALMAIRGVLRLSPARARRLQKELTALLVRLRGETAKKGTPRPKSRRPPARYSLTISLLALDEECGGAGS